MATGIAFREEAEIIVTLAQNGGLQIKNFV
jgi:hypothetical protein